MFKQRFLASTAIVWALLAAGCGAANKPAAAPSSTSPVGSGDASSKPEVIAPNPAGMPVPNPSAFSEGVAICTNRQISGGIDYLEALEKARDKDDKTVGGKATNQAWKDRFDAIAKTTDVKQCNQLADSVAGAVGQRHTSAQTICNLRWGEGKGDAFKEATRSQLDTVITALRSAAAKPKLEDCRTAAAAARTDLLALVDTANATCSPRGRDGAETCFEILTRYCQDGNASADVDACTQNPPAATRELAERSPSEPNAQMRGVGAGAGLESAILTGATDFFVERAEQEMSLFAVEVVGNELCGNDSRVKLYLPKTCGLIGPPAEGQSAETLGPTPGAIRAAAKADLDALPATLIGKLKGDEDHPGDPNLACAAAFGWVVADQVGHGSDLITLLKDPAPALEQKLVEVNCAEGAKQDIKSLAKLLQQLLSGAPELVASQLRAGNFERLMATNRALADDVKDPEVQKKAERARKVLGEVLRRLVELDRTISAYHTDPTPARRVLMVVAAVQTVQPILEHLARTSKFKTDIQTSVNLFTQILNHQYTEAIVTVSSLEVMTLLPQNEQNLLGLTAGLAQADSSDDVKKTLQDAALPLGSWRRKNVPRWGITLTGMVGGSASYEFVTEKPQDNIDVSNGASLAPTLLVGADLHHGFGGSRFGIHVNVLDLGALATTRLDQPKATDEKGAATGSVDQNPDVRIEQVFAPGLFAYFGWGPFAIGPMATFVPSLRPYKDPNGDIQPLSVFRVGGVLAIDVSVLPLL